MRLKPSLQAIIWSSQIVDHFHNGKSHSQQIAQMSNLYQDSVHKKELKR